MGGVILAVTLTYIEKYLIDQTGMAAPRDHYLSTSLLALGMMLIAIKWGKVNLPVLTALSAMTLYIYIFHPFFIGMEPWFESVKLLNLYHWTAPLIVILMTLLLITALRFLGLLGKPVEESSRPIRSNNYE